MAVCVRPAEISDLDRLAHLRAQLWPDGPVAEHRKELTDLLASGRNGTLPMAILVAADDDGTPVGFLEVGLRSHADGCDPAQPVGFVEGWFVDETLRHRGIGRALMQAAEEWSRALGCREMASDTWVDHEQSIRAHQALGFEIVDRCVNFQKPL